MTATDLKHCLPRDRRRRGHRHLAFLALVGCTILGAGAFCIPQAHPSLNANLSLVGKAALVYDLTNGRTLYAKNAYQPLPLASITKLLTIYAASNALQPDSVVAITRRALARRGDKADRIFYVGETFRFEDLARLTLTASSNVGAEAIAEAAAAAERTDIATLLSRAARKAGLSRTRALNATGLDRSARVSGSRASARDVAVLAGKLLEHDPQLAEATTQSEVGIASLEGARHRFDNTDPYFTKHPGLLLSKTGYTRLAGGNLVIVVNAGARHPVAIVVLGSTRNGRFRDVSRLLAATLAHSSPQRRGERGEPLRNHR